MKILFNASKDLAHPSAGGSEIYVDQVIRGLRDRGHEVFLSAGGPAAKHDYESRDAGSTMGQFLRYPFWFMPRRRQFDLVVDVANGMTYYSPWLHRGPTVCLVHHVHTKMWAEWFSPPVAAFGRFLERRMMPLAYRSTTFVAVSESTKVALTGIGVDEDQIRIVHNATFVPTEPAAETVADEAPLFVAVARLVPHKQLHLLLDAWPKVRAATGGRLVIVGEGPERARLEPMLTDGATLAGRLDDEERDSLLAQATVLLQPSYVEGWGLVVMEAAAQGTPAIGLNVPGTRDSIVSGETGWLCYDFDDFVRTWTQVGRDPSGAGERGVAARHRAHTFGVEQTVAAFEAVALEAVAAHRRPVMAPNVIPT